MAPRIAKATTLDCSLGRPRVTRMRNCIGVLAIYTCPHGPCMTTNSVPLVWRHAPAEEILQPRLSNKTMACHQQAANALCAKIHTRRSNSVGCILAADFSSHERLCAAVMKTGRPLLHVQIAAASQFDGTQLHVRGTSYQSRQRAMHVIMLHHWHLQRVRYSDHVQHPGTQPGPRCHQYTQPCLLSIEGASWFIS